MPINPLNHHYSLENPASIYDEEAMTALELAGRTAAKVNECVEYVNQIPAKVAEDVEKHISNGDFDKQIDTYTKEVVQEVQDMENKFERETDDLETRLNHLLGGYNPGSTTGDAELLDMRVTPDGKVYVNAGEAMRKGYLSNYALAIDSSNYATKFPTANITETGIIRMNFYAGETNIPTGLPFTEYPGGVTTLITVGPNDGNLPYNIQVLFSTYKTWYRYASGEYQKWYEVGAFMGSKHTIFANNYEMTMPDVNNAGVGIVNMLFEEGATGIPANLPFTAWEGRMGMLITSYADWATGYYQSQMLVTIKGIYYRLRGADWEQWHTLVYTAERNKTLYMAASDNLIATLKKAYAENYSKVVVPAGTYDVLQHYKDHYGEGYFDNYVDYSGSDPFDRGLWLENIEVVFCPGATLMAQYTGNNANVQTYFSPIATGNNVILDGLFLNSAYLRYGVHADYNTGTEVSYFIARNCTIYHYGPGKNSQCFGCGLGIHVDWLFENCIFYTTNPGERVLRIHNNVSPDAKSRVVIRNCYIDGDGYFMFNHYSDSEDVTYIMVTGCSYKTPPVVGYEIAGAETPENMKLWAFNNELRT